MNDFRELHEMYHHGIKGMHWGIRRFQNEDGTLTAAGRRRYEKELNKMDKKASLHAADSLAYKRHADELSKSAEGIRKLGDERKFKIAERKEKQAKELYEKMEKEGSKAKAIESEQWKKVGDALSKGANVATRKVTRTDPRLQQMNAAVFPVAFLTGVIGAAGASGAANVIYSNNYGNYRNTWGRIEGNKFMLSPSEKEKGTFTTIIDMKDVENEMKKIRQQGL